MFPGIPPSSRPSSACMLRIQPCFTHSGSPFPLPRRSGTLGVSSTKWHPVHNLDSGLCQPRHAREDPWLGGRAPVWQCSCCCESPLGGQVPSVR